MPLIPSITAVHDAMIGWRRDVHRHPELAYAEHRTAAAVADLLLSFGVDEVVSGVGHTGVVGVLRNGQGPAIGLRADMDALPIQERNEHDYCSVHDNVMHACGHDGHTAMLLGAAHHLAQTRTFRGTVVLIFQPAEEGQAGAKAMIADGLLERFPIDSVYALHNLPGLAAGTFAVSSGAVMAAADRFIIHVQGKGGHAAAPHQVHDPVIAGAAVVMALQTIVSRNVPPTETAVLSVTEFHGGDAFNVVPDSVHLGGTVRYFDTDVGNMIQERIETILKGIATAYGVEITLNYRTGYPPTINSAPESEIARLTAAEVVGTDRVVTQTPVMFSEDFSYFLQAMPGAYVFLGNGGDNSGYGLHSPWYDFNESILPIGASFLVRLAERG